MAIAVQSIAVDGEDPALQASVSSPANDQSRVTYEVATIAPYCLCVALNTAGGVLDDGRAVRADGRVGVTELVRDVLEGGLGLEFREVEALRLRDDKQV